MYYNNIGYEFSQQDNLKSTKITYVSNTVISNTGYDSACGNILMSKGKHHFKFKILNY